MPQGGRKAKEKLSRCVSIALLVCFKEDNVFLFIIVMLSL